MLLPSNHEKEIRSISMTEIKSYFKIGKERNDGLVIVSIYINIDEGRCSLKTKPFGVLLNVLEIFCSL